MKLVRINVESNLTYAILADCLLTNYTVTILLNMETVCLAG